MSSLRLVTLGAPLVAYVAVISLVLAGWITSDGAGWGEGGRGADSN
ncbi:MAG: hypothetical protein JXX28_05695 [Deltaproteobacteria bacterium]|nr:hypothetical protein [Deltaproteobacteria bacterium]